MGSCGWINTGGIRRREVEGDAAAAVAVVVAAAVAAVIVWFTYRRKSANY